MKVTGGTRSTGGKPVPVPLGPPQISHGLILDRTQPRKKQGAGEVNSKVSSDSFMG
jgi:hypothetical protein